MPLNRAKYLVELFPIASFFIQGSKCRSCKKSIPKSYVVLEVITGALFGLLAWRGFRIAHRHSEPFAQLVAAGLTLVIVLQAMINIGVVLGLLPTKGIGLPFISYGGSSIMAFLSIGGLLLSLSRELRER